MSFKIRVSFLIFCLDELFIYVSKVLKSSTIIVLHQLLPVIFSCSYIGYIDACKHYIHLLDWSLYRYTMPFWFFCCCCYRLYFKVYFVWYRYCYPSFLLVPICLKYCFPSLHIQSVCLQIWSESLLGSKYMRHVLFCLIYSATVFMSLDWSIFSIYI